MPQQQPQILRSWPDLAKRLKCNTAVSLFQATVIIPLGDDIFWCVLYIKNGKPLLKEVWLKMFSPVAC
jgi:hypothetical protein